MRKHVNRLGLIGSTLALVVVSSSAVFALPTQASVHAQSVTNTTVPAPTDTATTSPGQSPTGQNDGQAHLDAAKLKSCKNREAAINNIMNRINTRAQNQLTLFGTIATRVEGFYTSKGKTVSNYDQLVAAITAAKTQATTDLSTLQSNSTFSCSSSDPKGAVTAFQGYLKTEITDLQTYRTAVKNLIVAVASANGETVSSSNQSPTTGGQ